MNDVTRNIDTVTAEIIIIRDQTARTIKNGIIEIGRRLEEAKQMVPQGEWLTYLETVLHFKPSTAQNYMRIAREFGDGQVALDGMSAEDLFGELGYSQLVPLLGLPDEGRRELAEANDLPEMSSREIKKLVDDYKAAQAAKEHADRQAADAAELADKADKAAEKAEKQMEIERHAREAAEAKNAELSGRVDDLMRQLKEKPIEVQAEIVPDEELLERAREQVRQETENALRDAESRAEAAQAALEQAKNPTAHQVNFIFSELRDMAARLGAAFDKLKEEQPETAGKFGAVIGQWMAGTAADWNL